MKKLWFLFVSAAGTHQSAMKPWKIKYFVITTSRKKETKKEDSILPHKLLEHIWKFFFDKNL